MKFFHMRVHILHIVQSYPQATSTNIVCLLRLNWQTENNITPPYDIIVYLYVYVYM